jgi:bla regulator protein blaR1
MVSRTVVVAVVVGFGFVGSATAQSPANTAFENALRSGHDGVTAPKLLRQVEPKYTDSALHAGISGDVSLEAIVERDGTVGAVRVTKSLDPGLDRQAVAAAKEWLFEPGRQNGQPVPVIVTLILSFRPDDQAQAPGAAVSSREMPTGPYLTDARKSAGLVNPVVLRRVEAKYTSDAMRAKVQGDVGVKAIVLADGTVGDVWVVKPLDDQLDQQAIVAAKQWRFQPGTLNGRPVACVVDLSVTFRLH